MLCATSSAHRVHTCGNLRVSVTVDCQGILKRRGAESAEEVLKELCVLCDSAFQTSTRNLKFSHRSLKSQSTGAESVSSKFHALDSFQQRTMHRTKLKSMKKVARSIKERLPNVVSYCTHRITNAVAEVINSKIMAIKRRVGGYRNPENFKTAIYFYCGGLDLYPQSTQMDLKNGIIPERFSCEKNGFHFTHCFFDGGFARSLYYVFRGIFT